MQFKVGNKVILEVSANELFYLKNIVVSPKDQVQKGIRGKISQSRKKTRREWIDKLIAKGLDVPHDETAFVALIKAQPEYKTRRETEEVDKDVRDICLDSNKLAKSTCPLTNTEAIIFKTGQAPVDECDIH